MAGYYGYSKSNNAVKAESNGRYTATRMAKELKRFSQFKGVVAADIKTAFYAGEWHHTSKFYNRTNYYDFRDLAELEVRRNLRQAIADRKAAKSNEPVITDVKCGKCGYVSKSHYKLGDKWFDTAATCYRLTDPTDRKSQCGGEVK